MKCPYCMRNITRPREASHCPRCGKWISSLDLARMDAIAATPVRLQRYKAFPRNDGLWNVVQLDTDKRLGQNDVVATTTSAEPARVIAALLDQAFYEDQIRAAWHLLSQPGKRAVLWMAHLAWHLDQALAAEPPDVEEAPQFQPVLEALSTLYERYYSAEANHEQAQALMDDLATLMQVWDAWLN